jgi:hypothetical protein
MLVDIKGSPSSVKPVELIRREPHAQTIFDAAGPVAGFCVDNRGM